VKGLDLKEAVREAKDFVTTAIAASRTFTIGRGSGPLQHFFKAGRET
jgi:hydroxymethylpyrimidine/phosphomethylpyrimidine kinase